MAHLLPPFMALESLSKGGYVFFLQNSGNVSCAGTTIFDPYAKIAVEKSETDDGLINLRFSANNKYLAADRDKRYIVATSNKPQEDPNKPDCTLWGIGFTALRLYIFLSGSGGLWWSRDNTNSRLGLNGFSRREEFTVVDWGTLVQLPRHVAFKGYNDKYVDVVRASRREYLRCLSDSKNTAATSYEASLHADGHLRFKSVQHNTFWVRTGNWIASDSNDDSGRDRETLFRPTRVNENTIALRTPGNDRFIVYQNTRNAYLSSEATTITNEARFVVEELVLERSLYNVRYRLEDARVYNETPFVAGVGSARNDSNTESVMTIVVKFEEETSFTFTNSVSLTLGISTDITAGLPFIAGGTISISAEVTNTMEWNRTKTETKSVEASYAATVPPMSEVQVSYIGTRGTCDVPFNYTQRDVSSTDGRPIVSQQADGVYTGISYYNYHFDQPRIRSLLELLE